MSNKLADRTLAELLGEVWRAAGGALVRRMILTPHKDFSRIRNVTNPFVLSKRRPPPGGFLFAHHMAIAFRL
jgi:hypothetical protein